MLRDFTIEWCSYIYLFLTIKSLKNLCLNECCFACMHVFLVILNMHVFVFILLVASEVSVSNDESLSEAEKLFNSRQKRALRSLQFPGDCKAKTLINFAKKCGLKVEAGGSHWKVYNGTTLLTTIPHKVKPNGTGRNIINTLNDRC